MRSRGFTLVEVLMVVLIIGTLACLALPTFIGMKVKAEFAKLLLTMEPFQREAEIWLSEIGGWQSANQDAYEDSGLSYYLELPSRYSFVCRFETVDERKAFTINLSDWYITESVCEKRIFEGGEVEWYVNVSYDGGKGRYIYGFLKSTRARVVTSP